MPSPIRRPSAPRWRRAPPPPQDGRIVTFGIGPTRARDRLWLAGGRGGDPCRRPRAGPLRREARRRHAPPSSSPIGRHLLERGRLPGPRADPDRGVPRPMRPRSWPRSRPRSSAAETRSRLHPARPRRLGGGARGFDRLRDDGEGRQPVGGALRRALVRPRQLGVGLAGKPAATTPATRCRDQATAFDCEQHAAALGKRRDRAGRASG